MMGVVEVLIDPDRISLRSVDVEVADPNQIPAIRTLIWSHLQSDKDNVLRLRMDEAIFTQFRDYDGLIGFKFTSVSARSELAQRLQSEIPFWCTNEVIQSLRLLGKVSNGQEFPDNWSADQKMLATISPGLLSVATSGALLYQLWHLGRPCAFLMGCSTFIDHAVTILSKDYTEHDRNLIFGCLRNENSVSQLKGIIQNAFYERLRRFAATNGIAFVLPAREFPESITKKLPIEDKLLWAIVAPDPYLLLLTRQVIEKIRQGKLDASELPKLIFGYSKSQLHEIGSSVSLVPALATQELLDALNRWEIPETTDLTKEISDLLEEEPPIALLPASNAKEAIEWGMQYLKYAKSRFKHEKEPAVELCESFEQWVDQNPARLQNLDYSWRATSRAVRTALGSGDKVVLFVVDALGAVVADALFTSLKGLDPEIDATWQLLFAPLPTLTEIGKIAVATGIDAFKLPKNQEDAIWSAYQDVLASQKELQIAKSWTISDTFLYDDTRLLVLFENQLDDKLHECLTYSALSAQLEIVVQNLVEQVKRVFHGNGPLQNRIQVIISADHGLTRIGEVRAPKWQGPDQIHERCIRSSSKAGKPEGYFVVTPEGAGNDLRYLVCRARHRLIAGPVPFVHGGMTPEEILIPLITVRKATREHGQSGVSLPHGPVVVSRTTDGWLIHIVIKSGDQALRSCTIEAISPFHGRSLATDVPANSSKEFLLQVTSDIPQAGSVIIEVNARYVLSASTTYTSSRHVVETSLPELLLIKDGGARDFDNMFD